MAMTSRVASVGAISEEGKAGVSCAVTFWTEMTFRSCSQILSPTGLLRSTFLDVLVILSPYLSDSEDNLFDRK